MTAAARWAAIGGASLVAFATLAVGRAWGETETGSGSGAGSGVGSGSAKSAGASPVESSDVPALAPNPPRFSVAPFENHTGQRAQDWMIWAAPFELAEKT